MPAEDVEGGISPGGAFVISFAHEVFDEEGELSDTTSAARGLQFSTADILSFEADRRACRHGFRAPAGHSPPVGQGRLAAVTGFRSARRTVGR